MEVKLVGLLIPLNTLVKHQHRDSCFETLSGRAIHLCLGLSVRYFSRVTALTSLSKVAGIRFWQMGHHVHGSRLSLRRVESAGLQATITSGVMLGPLSFYLHCNSAGGLRALGTALLCNSGNLVTATS